MKELKREYAPQDIAEAILIEAMEHLADCPMKTAERFRNCATRVEGTLFSINPLLKIESVEGAEFIQSMIEMTAHEGRIIDFGYLPNEVLKTESDRARDVFEAGELQHPFENWIGLTSWEGGFNGYHICPHPIFKEETLVIEIYGVSLPGLGDLIIVYDMVAIKIGGPHNTTLSPLRMDAPEMNTSEEIAKRASNSLDPMVTMLRILADASIPVVHKAAPDKLNKIRLKKGQPPIPSHNVVLTADYVAAFKAHADKRISKGGHHASPIAHWRRAHQRLLASGRTVPVRSSKVNWRDATDLHRLFYRLPK